jgi:hypothetical protein
MGVILAAFFFGIITLGFTLLTLLPFFLVWLMVGVYLEPERRPVIAEGSVPANAAPDMVRAHGWMERRTRSTSVIGQEALTPVDHLIRAGR